ncbi:MAG: sugar phosphate isomerase/epimerase family protein [Coriobacteriia bacterium]|nr:sugar phosphate isomerase/epimerase family protein [Coriobacteriia bacterium]
MELAMATDYAGDTGNAEPALTRIAEAGFQHIQWIHHWRHDFIYTEPEIRHIEHLLKRLSLSLYDIHAPAGAEKNWYSTVEYQRQAGVEIIKNRVEMGRNLGGSVIVAHTPPMSPANRGAWSQLRRSLDELEGYCTARSIRIAVENRPNDTFTEIRALFSEYGPDFLGLCYDSGHGNIGGMGLQHLESVKERLISLHLHDNDGDADQHGPLFSGTVDWGELVRIVAESPYDQFLTFETEMRRSGLHDEALFLKCAHHDGMKLLSMLQGHASRAPVT